MDDDEQASDVVGNGADDRMEYAEQIADSAEAEQHPDLETFSEDPTDLESVEDRVEAARIANEQEWAKRQAWLEEQEAKQARDAAEKAAEKLYRVVVDGQERFLTETQVLAQASKGEAADKRLQQAAEARKQAELERQEAAALLQNAKAQAQPEDPDEALAKQLQAMPPGEAAKVFKQLREQYVPRQQLTAVEAKVSNDLQFQAAGERAKQQYPDILADPIQRAAFLQLDADALDEQRRTGELESYAARHD